MNNFRDKWRRFKIPNKTIVYNSFHGLTDTTGQSYWAVIIKIFGVFSWFGNGYDSGFSPGRRKLSIFPNIIKNL